MARKTSPRTVRYDLGFNWAADRESVFTRTLRTAAKRRGLKVLRVLKSDTAAVHHRVDDGALRVATFLNTQADGSRFDSPAMLLCRAMKSSGAFVIEDPDDSRIYADRALQCRYLQRSGLGAPCHFVVDNWQPGRAVLTAAQQKQLGPAWVAQPATGLDRSRQVPGTGRISAAALGRAGFRPGQPILVRPAVKIPKPRHALRVRAWYLFGHVVPCEGFNDDAVLKVVRPAPDQWISISTVLQTVRRMAGITGLDWFVAEVLAPASGNTVTVVEPPNALADLGPGTKALSTVPPEVQRIAAERLAEVAWQRARNKPPADGTTLRVGEQ